jgi:TldD protein
VKHLLAMSLGALAVLGGAALLATPPADAKSVIVPRPPVAPNTVSTAVTDAIVDAVAAEMDRAMARLHLGDASVPPPYFISYKITEVEVNDVAASLGSTLSKKERHFVNLEARVRVGSTALDNGNFVVPGEESLDGVSGINLPLEATPRIAARAAWLITDSAYKEALIQLRAKLDARRTGAIASSDVPSWTTAAPVVDEQQVAATALETVADMEVRAQALSRAFRGAPQVRDSRVALTSYLERRWYLTSEGSSLTDTRRVSGVLVTAAGQADDGQELSDYFARYGHTTADLPTDAELEAATKAIIANIGALRAAPVSTPYSGPVLFESEGAVGMLRYSLAPHLGGTPLPGGLSPAEAKQFGGALTDKLGLRVLAPSLSIFDDPTLAAAEGKALIGGYRIDDEGVAAGRVDVVTKGALASLLTSRTPSAKGAVSNGHARRTTSGGVFHGSATNLVVSSTGGLARKQLVAKLIAAAKAEGLPYGMIIKRFDDPAITAEPELSRRELVQMIKAADTDLAPPSLVAYRVYPDGREELVRGAQLGELDIKAWKDVLATSKGRTVFNYLATSDSPVFVRASGGNDEGFVPSSGIESAVVTPDLLFKDVDVIVNTAGTRAEPAIPAPPLAP